MRKRWNVVGCASAKESDVSEFFPSKAKLEETKSSVLTLLLLLLLLLFSGWRVSYS
jgi:hypothetical protein